MNWSGPDSPAPRADPAGLPARDVDEVEPRAVAFCACPPPACARPGAKRIACTATGVGELDGPADRLPRAQVGEAHDPGRRPRWPAAAVGADGEGQDRVAGQPAACGSPPGSAAGREQVAAGRGAILELDRGGGEQQGLLERRLAERERADPLGVGGQRLRLGGRLRLPRVVALTQREHAAGERHARAGAWPRRAGRAAGGWPRLGAPLAVGLGAARVEERALGGVELDAPSSASSTRRGGRRGTGRTARGRRRPTGARRRPSCRCTRMPARSSSSQRRSRGHSRISASWATSAVPSSSVTRRASAEPLAAARRRSSGRRALGHELVDRHAPARVLDALAELGHAQEDAARQPALLVRQRVDDGVGRAGDRRGDAAARAVALDGQRAAVAPLPRRAQRVREQRQRAGLVGDVAQDSSTRPGSSRRPASRAGSVMARASSSALIGPSSTWLAATARASSAWPLEPRRRRRRAPRSTTAQRERQQARR